MMTLVYWWLIWDVRKCVSIVRVSIISILTIGFDIIIVVLILRGFGIIK